MMIYAKKICIVGATGAVGKQLTELLKKRGAKDLTLVASLAAQGVCTLEDVEDHFDLVFLAAGSAVSKQVIKERRFKNGKIIDLSSAFRSHPDIPLIIPEINAKKLKNHVLIASPNCVASIAAVALYPIHRVNPLKRLVITAFQAASGGGKKMEQKLIHDTGKALSKEKISDPLFYGFNLFSHNSPLNANGYVDEEMKIRDELKKILDAPELKISVTSIRVPVKRAHSISVNIECTHPIGKEIIYALLKGAKGVKIYEDREKNQFATPLIASNEENVLVGRIRCDCDQENTFEMWIVGDQLLKGAALNAVQIGELI